MTIHMQPSETDWAKEQTPTQSHRWIVHLLAEMIQYTEKHELNEVVGPLTDAIEQIAPILAGAAQTSFGLNSSSGDQTEVETSNILDFMKRGPR